MESLCECCGESSSSYYFGICVACIKTLPTLKTQLKMAKYNYDGAMLDLKRQGELIDDVVQDATPSGHFGCDEDYMINATLVDALAAERNKQ